MLSSLVVTPQRDAIDAIQRFVDSEMAAGSFRGVLSRDRLNDLVAGERPRALNWMAELLPMAASFASPATSGFPVGAVALGGSGSVYFGANLEVKGEALAFTLHAEQSVVVNALVSGEKELTAMATSSWPCGQCRQFLYELACAQQLRILVAEQEEALVDLLPHPFGPADLGIEAGLLDHVRGGIDLRVSAPSRRASALHAARLSYAPYSKSPCGVAIATDDGVVVSAPYVENAAFNPSVEPAVAALSLARLRGIELNTIVAATLVEAPGATICHEAVTRAVLRAVRSDIQLEIDRVAL